MVEGKAVKELLYQITCELEELDRMTRQELLYWIESVCDGWDNGRQENR
jgi:hypothetical protein